MASKKELFKKKSQEITNIHNTPKPTALGAFNDVERVKSSIEILPELQQFIRPLSTEQFAQLEQNIITHGCQDALVLWETTEFDLQRGDSERPVYVLVDGHNRYEICKKHRIDFKITLKIFESIEAVKEYMIDLQIGRRNLTQEEESYYRGLKYNNLKSWRGVALQNAKKGEGAVNVAEDLAKKFDVSSRTIKNDGKFAEGIQKLSPELRHEVLQGNSKISRKTIQNLADEQIVDGSFQALVQEENKTQSDDKNTLLTEINKLSRNLNTPADCDLLVSKVMAYKKVL